MRLRQAIGKPRQVLHGNAECRNSRTDPAADPLLSRSLSELVVENAILDKKGRR